MRNVLPMPERLLQSTKLQFKLRLRERLKRTRRRLRLRLLLLPPLLLRELRGNKHINKIKIITTYSSTC